MSGARWASTREDNTMHRKHYKAIAEILKNHQAQLDGLMDTPQVKDSFYYLVESLISLCTDDNANFDRDKFWKAVEIL
jgi:hypothetical protein